MISNIEKKEFLDRRNIRSNIDKLLVLENMGKDQK